MRHKAVRLLICICCILVPLAAHAWTLSTWVKSAGGSITSPNMTGNQTVANGSVNNTYTTTSPQTVIVTPNYGYSISKLVRNGFIETLADPSAVYTTTVVGPPNQSVQATFARITYTLSASAGPGETVTPASISPVYAGVQSPAKVFTFTPASGHRIQTVTIPGHALNADYQLFNATTNAMLSLPAEINVRVKVSIYNVKSDSALTSTAEVVGANAGPSQTVLPGTSVTLDGSASAGASSYAWIQESGPAMVTLSAADTSKATFVAPDILGNYLFKLTINNSSSATTSVYVADSLAQPARTQCADCHASQGVGQGVYANWSTSKHKDKAVMCYTCHVGANTGGHPGAINTGTIDARTFKNIAAGGNFCITCHDAAIVTEFESSESRHFARAGAASCSFCHANAHNVNAACVNCHTPGNTLGLLWPPAGSAFHDAYTGTNRCGQCHNTHTAVPTGCDSCHDAPPLTASHLKHYGGTVAQAAYGDTKITQEFGANGTVYIFGCGNCHPQDGNKHNNGTVEVELYNSLTAVGSIKSLNPASAAYLAGTEFFTDSKGHSYTKGSCSNVYCHSFNEWTTTAPIPDGDPNWQAKVVTTRKYKTVTWGGAPLGCTGCHGNPTRTSYLTNDGGAGDSHSWMDKYGYENLHNYNHGWDPLSCSYCHNGTVKQLNTYTQDGMGVRTLGEVPISNFSKHVNGSNDVSFDTQNPFVYTVWNRPPVSRSLVDATYDPATKNCSNVSCHRGQTTVKWGTPYRWYYNECNACHSY